MLGVLQATMGPKTLLLLVKKFLFGSEPSSSAGLLGQHDKLPPHGAAQRAEAVRTPIFSELPSAACRSQHWVQRAPTTLINPEGVPFPVQPSATFFQTPTNAPGTSPAAKPRSPSPLPWLALEPLGHGALPPPSLLITSLCWSSGGLLGRHVLPPSHPADPSASERG